MTAQGLRRFILLVLAAALLALLLGRVQDGKPQASHSVGAQVPADSGGNVDGAVAHEATATARVRSPTLQAVLAQASEVALDMRCLAERNRHLLALYRDTDPRRSPGDALDRLLAAQAILAADGIPASELTASIVDARQRWPDDVELAWHSAAACRDKDGCDQQAAIAHLLRLEPDNAAAWAMAMTRAQRRDDVAGYERALQGAAQSDHVDSHFGTVFIRLAPLLARRRTSKECTPSAGGLADAGYLLGHAPGRDDIAAFEAMALEMAIGLPAYQSLQGCSTESVAAFPHRRQACTATLTLFTQGDTLLTRGIGFGYLLPLVRGEPGSERLREQYRRHRWLMRLASEPLPPGVGLETIAFLGEVESLRQRAIAAGQWPPPADFD